jgi:UDP-GlcNAc:undecaprenyl-phosphate GlcNAc-1-phosphate transferase
LSFAGPLLVSWLLTAGLIHWAPHLGLVDYPDPRKVHTRPMPRGGGLAIFAALALTAALLSRDPLSASLYPLPERFGLKMLLGFLVVVLGLVDDLRPLPWQFRLGVQAAVAAAAVLACLPATGVGARLAAVLWVVGLINAFNMLDNMDALSGGVAWVAAGFLVLAVVLQPQAEGGTPVGSALPFLMLMGALSGFLWFNAPPARIFMGDAGSTFLGFFLGLGGAEAALWSDALPWGWAVPVCVCAVPCYDLLSVVTLRLCQGRSPFHADKQHLSHRLVERGLPAPTAVRLIYLLALASGASGLLLYEVASWAGAALALSQLAAWWSALAAIEYFTHQKSAVRSQKLEVRSQTSDKTEATRASDH